MVPVVTCLVLAWRVHKQERENPSETELRGRTSVIPVIVFIFKSSQKIIREDDARILHYIPNMN